MKSVSILLLFLSAVLPAAAAQSLDAPALPDRSKKGQKSGNEVQFEIKGVVEIDKSPLVACSEGAASGEDLENALKACDVAIAQDPTNGDAQYYRGFVLYHFELYREAEEAFTAAIDLGADRLAESFFQRGACKEHQRRLREASLDFKMAHELKPEWSAARRKVDEYRWAYQ